MINSASVCTGPFKWSICCVVSFGSLCFSEGCFIWSVLSAWCVQDGMHHALCPHYLFDACGVCRETCPFIPGIDNLSSFVSLHCWGLKNFIDLLIGASFCLFNSGLSVFSFNDFCSPLSPLFNSFGLFFFSFTRSLQLGAVFYWFGCFFLFFLKYTFDLQKFLLALLLWCNTKFNILYFYFHSGQWILNIFSWNFLDLLIVSMLFSFHIFGGWLSS